MLHLLALLNVSFAQDTIDCAGLTATCDDLNAMAPAVNALAGTNVIDESGRTRNRPSTLYTKLDALRTTAEDAGCSITGWTGTRYITPNYDSVWDVSGGSSPTVDLASGTINTGDKSFEHIYTDGGDFGLVGTEASRYSRNGKLYADRDGGFMVGLMVRERGTRGVSVNLHGTCPGPVDPAMVFDNWFGAPGLADFFVAPVPEDEVCDDLVDNDLDGDTDCDDSDCAADPACILPPPDEVCDDLIDNDLDGDADCADSDCAAHPACIVIPVEDCTDGIDNDGDSDTDCDDLDCALDPVCQDADGDSFLAGEDCDDSDPSVFPGAVDVCGDGIDNNCDGDTDETCEPESCDDSVDNDGDGDTDCDDTDCALDPVCGEPEVCDDGLDNDLDGDTDCDDTDCALDLSCQIVAPQSFLEDFETDGNGTRYTTSTAEFTDGSNDYFGRFEATAVPAVNAIGNSAPGNFVFAAEDIDGEGASSTQTLTFNDISIAGMAFPVFSFEIAATGGNDVGGSRYDAADHVYVDVDVDGAGMTRIFAFESTGDQSNEPFALDTDADGLGDGTFLTNDLTVFEEFITAGAELDVQVTFTVNAGSEEVSIDNVRVYDLAAD